MAVLLLAGCSKGEPDLAARAPPRVATPVAFPIQESRVVVPVRARLADVTAAAERAIPRTLWSIDKSGITCIKGARAKIGGHRVKVTPDFRCTITGHVTRGPIRITGRGERLRLAMPVSAVISAQDVAGVLHESAKASAVVTADMRLGMAENWRPTADIDLAHEWKDPPHIDFLGQRIELASRADPKLKAVLDELERTLPAELAKFGLHREIEAAWRAGFTDISVNRANPQVWMRVTPIALGYGGHRVVGRDIEMVVALKATTEGFVGDRPKPPAPTPLPPPSQPGRATGLSLLLPIIADYRELEPIVLKALTKLNAKGIDLPEVGRVEATFHRVTIYPTEGGRVAVGVDAAVRPAGSSRRPVRGVVWLAAVPVNAPGATRIEWRDLEIVGETDRRALNLLLKLFRSQLVGDEVRNALALNLQGDYDKLLAKARAAVAAKQIGDVRLEATINKVAHGQLVAAGQGLFLPVTARGTAVLRYAPAPRANAERRATAGR